MRNQFCRGIWKSQQLRVVIKMMRGSRADLERECVLLQSLSHPRVLPLLGVCATDGDRQMLIAERLSHQSLGSYTQAARKQNVVTSMVRRVRWCIECAEGLAYLHAQQPPIAYRSVQPSNFLLDAEEHVKIGTLLHEHGGAPQ
jgi:serine/threonine-protein kinase